MLTHHDIDWFYVCVNHINDASFCKPVSPAQPIATKDVVEMKKKNSAQKNTKEDDVNVKAKEQMTERSPAANPVAPISQKEYILDQKIFYLRENQYKQKQSSKKAKQVAAQIPSVPGNLK